MLAEGLGALQRRYPTVEIGSYPYFSSGSFGVSLVLRSTDAALLAEAADAVAALVRELGGDPTLTEGAT